MERGISEFGLVFVFAMQKNQFMNESFNFYTKGISVRFDILFYLTNEPLIHCEVLIPITNQFVFVFVFVMAHEQAISKLI